MPSISDAKKALEVAGHSLKGLEMVGELARLHLASPENHVVSLDTANKALALIRTVYSVAMAIKDGLDGAKPLEEVDAEIQKLAGSLASNDATIRGDLDAKFGK